LTAPRALADSAGVDLKTRARRAAPRTYEALANLAHRGYYSRGVAAHRAIFIHIPKTGGTSISRIFPGNGRSHATWWEYWRASPRKFGECFKFSVVRNPWDRVVSAYWFLQQWADPGGDPDASHCEGEERAFAFGTTTSFDQFVHERLHLCLDQPHFRPQHLYIFDGDVNRMDFTGRFENLATDFAVICARLGLKASLPHDNASEHGDFRSYYTPETRNIVGEVYADDVRLLGY